MKSKRIGALICSLALITSAFAGCSGAASNSGAASAASNDGSKPVTLTVAYQVSGTTDPIGDWLKELIQDYKTKKPNVQINPAPITADENTYYTKLDLMMKSGTSSPDIVNEDTFLISSDAAAGYLEPITDAMNSWEEWPQVTTNVKKGVTIDGKVYGIPSSTDSRGIWYNKELFKKAGLPAEWAPKTWDDILSASKTIKEKLNGVTPFVMYNGKAIGEGTSMQCYEMLLYGTGETLLDNSGKWIVSSPNILSTLKFIDTINRGGYGAGTAMITNGQEGSIVANQLIPQGKVAMLLDGYWASGAWKTAMKDYQNTMGFVAMPTQKGQEPGSITMSGGWAWSLTKNSANKEAATDFLKFMCNKDNLKKLVLAQGNLSPRSDIASDPEYINSNPFNKVATEFLKNAQFRPTDPNYSSVSTAIQTMVEAVATGSATPEAAMQSYANDVKRIVGADKTTTIQ